MLVKDITHLHKELVEIARSYGEPYPEDTIQDVWIKLMEIEHKEGCLDRLLENDCSINKNYLYTMIKHSLIDKKRVYKNHSSLEEEEEEIIKLSIQQENKDKYNLLIEIIARLSKANRHIILSYTQDILETERSLAKKFGISNATMHRKLYRIRQRIRSRYFKEKRNEDQLENRKNNRGIERFTVRKK